MKNLVTIILFQLILAIISAYLLSEMSFFGKVGISLFYKEYSILKNPLLTSSIIFGAQILIITILQILYLKANPKTKNLVSIIILVLAIAGLYFTYLDFAKEFSHKILKSKFHFGAYLIWIGFMVSATFYLFKQKTTKNS